MTIGILALQGAFAEHETMLQGLGVTCVELRKKRDLEKKIDGLILPGGESTVQGKLLREFDMLSTIQEKIKKGMPVLATCAGMILLAERINHDETVHLGTLPVVVERNAYGRQLGSFYTEADVLNLKAVPMPFIRAPYVEETKEEVEILARVDEKIVGVRYQKQIALSFHPELTKDTRMHELFLESIA